MISSLRSTKLFLFRATHTLSVAVTIGVLSTGCHRRVTSASSPQEIETESKAFIEKAIAEDRARVADAHEDESQSIRESAERMAEQEKDRKKDQARAATESANVAEEERKQNAKEDSEKRGKAENYAKLKAEMIAAEQKINAVDARNVQFAQPAKAEFEKFILVDLQERKDASVLAGVELESRGGAEISYTVELYAPRYEIWPADLEAERATFSTADRLNAKLVGLEWRGFAFVDAAAYRVLNRKEVEARNTVKLFPTKRPDYEDGTWQDAHAYKKPQLPLIGTYKIEKTAEGWKIEEIEKLTKPRFLDDWRSGRERLQTPGGPVLPSQKPKLVAEGALSLKRVESKSGTGDSKGVEEAKAEFEKYVLQRTPETLTLKSEERASKVVIDGIESPYYTKQTTKEFHAPTVAVKVVALNEADRLNGVEWRGQILLKADSYRIVAISPKPLKRIPSEDGTWQSNYGDEEFIVTKKGGEWSLAPKLAPNANRILKK